QRRQPRASFVSAHAVRYSSAPVYGQNDSEPALPVHRCTKPPSGGLPADAVAAFHRDGVLIIENFKRREDCEALRARANALVLEHGPQAVGTIFSTKNPQHADSDYFMRSANGIGVFFEEEAFDAD